MIRLSVPSLMRIQYSILTSGVDIDYARPILRYLLCGVEPGSFLTGVLQNKFTAIAHSHPSNTVESLKNLLYWLDQWVPRSAYGSEEAYNDWLRMSAESRRAALEDSQFILSPAQETMAHLKNSAAVQEFAVRLQIKSSAPHFLKEHLDIDLDAVE